ncbi:uncharacterized protein LOC106012771 [Aplysia californica]|uniref:Uncharacterized protein LOC106012771 n=1 Tax=Aplysia californica TaxID=6500 RepID=A0ABM1A732_APLCA|nr:uncharacterized protein LOC106012771 [Aplysia californica]
MSSHVLFGLMVLSVCGSIPGAVSECIMPQDMRVVQTQCKEVNEKFSAAEGEHDREGTCKYLFELIKCVATDVPRCLDYMTQHHAFYQNSPFSCAFTSEQIRELQAIRNAKNQEVTHVPLTPSPSPKPTQATPTSSGQGEEGGATEEKGGDKDHTSGPGRGGTKEEHRKNNDNNAASSLWQGHPHMLLLVSTLLTLTVRRLIS